MTIKINLVLLCAFVSSWFKKILPTFLSIFIVTNSFAQNNFSLNIKNHSNEPLREANILVVQIKKNFTTDSAGYVSITNLPAGKYRLVISYAGMQEKEIEIFIPSTQSSLTIELEPAGEEEELIIQSTRSSRTIKDIPTRVEFVAGEELDEKANMKPGDIRMVLNESTGIQTQQTSATSANASIRIQGLDGRYTQVLRDGFPVYSGFSSGLSLLQTPPLDLKQFEVIKGSASTLYGGGAIAGLVNLISKTPTEERELKFHLDLTSAGGINTSGFFGKKFGKAGVTIFASRNSNSAFDPSDIGLTAIPKFQRYTVNPKLFLYFSDKTEMMAGINIMTEERTGGDIQYIKGNNPSGFFEQNNSNRYSTQFQLKHHIGTSGVIGLKNSWSRFERSILVKSTYAFNGTQDGTFTELTYNYLKGAMEWITGVNLLSDVFKEQRITNFTRDYNQVTTGLFLQNNWKVNEHINIETGLRGDKVSDYDFIFLPRLSALFKITPKLTSRVGGGSGYKAPNIFTEESERLHYARVLPVDSKINKIERSVGLNADINYKTNISADADFSINHLFFYTRIKDPLLLQPAAGSDLRFNNIAGHLDSRGMETNIKIRYTDFKLFLGYTLVKAFKFESGIKQQTELTPKHRLNTVLIYEVEEKIKIGLEAYYFGKQLLNDGSYGKSYWINGLMAEKLWEKFSLYINFENFFDTRQTKFGPIYTGPIDNPAFRDIYAPLDGFVINGGIKLRI